MSQWVFEIWALSRSPEFILKNLWFELVVTTIIEICACEVFEGDTRASAQGEAVK